MEGLDWPVPESFTEPPPSVGVFQDPFPKPYRQFIPHGRTSWTAGQRQHPCQDGVVGYVISPIRPIKGGMTEDELPEEDFLDHGGGGLGS